jgi:hypothetical protein
MIIRSRNPRREKRLRAALIIPLALIAAAPLYCKDKKPKDEDGSPLRQTASGSLLIETSIAWRDVGTGAAVDWAAAPGSPSCSLEAEGSLDLAVSAIPWLRAGLTAMLDAEVRAKAKSPVDKEPYLIIRDETMLAAAGPYFGAKAGYGAWDAKLKVSALACVRILVQTDAAFDYQPTAATGEDFWFRALPAIGSALDASLAYGKSFSVEIGNFFIAWRGFEDAYGDPDSGFREEAKVAASGRLLSGGSIDLDAALKLSGAWDSGIILPSRALKARIESDLGLGGGLSFRLVPASIERTEDMPGFDPARSENAAIRLGGAFEWRQDVSDARMKIGLSWPYISWDGGGSADRSLGEWKATLAVELK